MGARADQLAPSVDKRRWRDDRQPVAVARQRGWPTLDPSTVERYDARIDELTADDELVHGVDHGWLG